MEASQKELCYKCRQLHAYSMLIRTLQVAAGGIFWSRRKESCRMSVRNSECQVGIPTWHFKMNNKNPRKWGYLLKVTQFLSVWSGLSPWLLIQWSGLLHLPKVCEGSLNLPRNQVAMPQRMSTKVYWSLSTQWLRDQVGKESPLVLRPAPQMRKFWPVSNLNFSCWNFNLIFFPFLLYCFAALESVMVAHFVCWYQLKILMDIFKSFKEKENKLFGKGILQISHR